MDRKDNPGGSFASDVLKLAGGTALAQALTILASPLITRIYGPESYGLAALFTAITGIFAVVSCLRYEQAIMLPDGEEDAGNILGISLIIAATISLMLAMVIWISKEPLLLLLNAPQLIPYMWLAPLAVFLSGAFVSLSFWNSRTRRFGRLSIARMSASISSIGVQIGAGLGGYPTGGSIIGANVIGSAISTLLLGIQIWRDDRKVLWDAIKFKKMRKALDRYRRFPIIDTLSALLNSISWQIPVFLLSTFFSISVVGLYSFCISVLQLPMSFIGSSITQVFFQRAAEAKAGENLSYIVKNVFQVLVIIGLFPMLILTIMGQDLFSIVFGGAWSEAGFYAQILALWTFLWFISSPLSSIYIILERQDFGLKFNLINIVTRFIAIGVGGWMGDARISIFLFAVSGILVYTYLLRSIFKLSGVPFAEAIRTIFKNMRLVFPAALLILALERSSFEPFSKIITVILLSILYYGFIIKTDPLIRSIL